MPKETPAVDPVIQITPDMKAEHERREKLAAQRDKKQKNPNDAAQPAAEPTSEPVSATDTASPGPQKATPSTAKKRK